MTSTDVHEGQRPATKTAATRTAGGEGEAYWFYGTLVVVRSPAGAQPIVIEHHLHPGGGAPLHLHHRLEDSFYLLAGEMVMRCEDETFVVHAGDYVSVPAGARHCQTAIGDREAVMLQTHAEPSFLNFIRAVGIPASAPRPDMATLDFAAMAQVAAETGQPVLGPPLSKDDLVAVVGQTT